MISCSSTHCVEIKDGVAYAFATHKQGNRFGQLGRGSSSSQGKASAGGGCGEDDIFSPREIPLPELPGGPSISGGGKKRVVVAAAAGGGPDAGHTAVIDDHGDLFTCGVDRWQQLGLGSEHAGGAGYTWGGGKIWQTRLQRVACLPGPAVDVACGGDYTVALVAAPRRKGCAGDEMGEKGTSVWGWGRSQNGQATGGRKGPFVSSPKPWASAAFAATAPPAPTLVPSPLLQSSLPAPPLSLSFSSSLATAAFSRVLASPAGDCTVLVRDMAAALVEAAAFISDGEESKGRQKGREHGQEHGKRKPLNWEEHGRCPKSMGASLVLKSATKINEGPRPLNT